MDTNFRCSVDRFPALSIIGSFPSIKTLWTAFQFQKEVDDILDNPKEVMD
jgi:hypothetical protein